MEIGNNNYILKKVEIEELDNIIEFEICYSNGLRVDDVVKISNNSPMIVDFIKGILETATYSRNSIEKCIEWVIEDIAEGYNFKSHIVRSSLEHHLDTTNLEKWLIKNKVLRYDFNQSLGLDEEYEDTEILRVVSYKMYIWLKGEKYELIREWKKHE